MCKQFLPKQSRSFTDQVNRELEDVSKGTRLSTSTTLHFLTNSVPRNLAPQKQQSCHM